MAKSKASGKKLVEQMTPEEFLKSVRDVPDHTLIEACGTCFQIGQEHGRVAAKGGAPYITPTEMDAIRLMAIRDAIAGKLRELQEQAQKCMEEHARLKVTMAEAVSLAERCEAMLGGHECGKK